MATTYNLDLRCRRELEFLSTRLRIKPTQGWLIDIVLIDNRVARTQQREYRVAHRKLLSTESVNLVLFFQPNHQF